MKAFQRFLNDALSRGHISWISNSKSHAWKCMILNERTLLWDFVAKPNLDGHPSLVLDRPFSLSEQIQSVEPFTFHAFLYNFKLKFPTWSFSCASTKVANSDSRVKNFDIGGFRTYKSSTLTIWNRDHRRKFSTESIGTTF